MESNRDDVNEALRDAARAEAAPWTDYPRTPAWYPPAVGAWATAYLLVAVLLHDRPVIATLVLIVLASLIGVFTAWYRRLRGALPRLRSMPPRFRPAVLRFLLGLAAVVLVAGLTAVSLPWVGASVLFVGVTAIVAWYERAYADAARRTSQDLV